MKTTCATLIFLCATSGLVIAGDDSAGPAISVKKPFEHAAKRGNTGTATPQISWHGGPVMNSAANAVYVIYYGTAFASTTQPIVNDFLYGLSGQLNYTVNDTYNEGGKTAFVPKTYTFDPPGGKGGSSVAYDNYSQGAQLGNKQIPLIIANAINNGGLQNDPNGVYFVITSPDVKVSGFCNSFCAYHTTADIRLASGTTAHIRYALVPDPTQRCSGCNGNIAVYGDKATPNGDFGADTMTDAIMHELSETVTDPDLNAWYTSNGEEDADLCNSVYGQVFTGSNSAGAYHYNVTLAGVPHSGSRNYLVQQIWTNQTPQGCAGK